MTFLLIQEVTELQFKGKHMEQQRTRWFHHILAGRLEERKGTEKKQKRKVWGKKEEAGNWISINLYKMEMMPEEEQVYRHS